jgi:transposase
LKPHQTRYWLNTTEVDLEKFEREAGAVCQAYLDAPRRQAEENTRTISVDEKTGIQALERIAPTKPTAPGQVERREFEYRRHGTSGLIAGMDVCTGEIVSPLIRETRTEEDFLEFLDGVIQIDPNARWVFVADNLNIHAGELIIRYVAECCGVDGDTLGKKGRSGALQSVATRKAFLSDPSRRIRFVFTPKHASWMNQIEIWFSILARRLLKRASFSSIDDLSDRLLSFIDYFNKLLAKPFKWTYTGRPLNL